MQIHAIDRSIAQRKILFCGLNINKRVHMYVYLSTRTYINAWCAFAMCRNSDTTAFCMLVTVAGHAECGCEPATSAPKSCLKMKMAIKACLDGNNI
jgi:hypothetical protein